MLATVLSLILANAAATGITNADGRLMTRDEIRDYNAKLPRNHPAYIRCERILEPGSLVKKTTLCRTNAEWVRTDTVGNENARDTLDRMESGSWRTSDDPPPGAGG